MDREEIRYDLNSIFHKHLNPDFHGEAWGRINALIEIEQDMERARHA